MNQLAFVTPITAWERWSLQEDEKTWDWSFNHIEDGHCPNDFPTPKVPLQKKAWAKGPWRKAFHYLDENFVVI